MKYLISLLYSLLFAAAALFVPTAQAVDISSDDLSAPPPDPIVDFYKAEVKGVETSNTAIGQQVLIQADILDGDRQGESIELNFYPPEIRTEEHNVAVGEVLVVSRTDAAGTIVYTMLDRYRLPWMIVLLVALFVLAIVLAGRRGVTALAGLTFGVLILVQVMIPQIAQGRNALLIGLLGALLIAVVSIYLAHGFNKQTSVAVTGTLLTISVTMFLAWLAIQLTQLFGTGSEEAYVLQQFSELKNLDLQGILLVSIVIGALGVLDDVTTALTASVAELKKANQKLKYKELVTSAMNIGREHITSLINTLVMAYAGASMPVLLLFTIDQRPLWVLLNSQFMAEEIVRAIVGSMALMLAVPITAALAAYYYQNDTKVVTHTTPHTHS